LPSVTRAVMIVAMWWCSAVETYGSPQMIAGTHMIFGTNGWSLRNYGICLLVAFRCGLSGHGGAACAGSLSLQEPTIPRRSARCKLLVSATPQAAFSAN